jgi:hypothetical protein
VSQPRPAPIRTQDNAFFWDAAAARRLVAQRCAECGTIRHPPRPMCAVCGALGIEVVELSGRGRVLSCVALHYPQNPRFDYPVLGALIDLDEGIRLVSNIVDAQLADVAIGDRVEVTFAATDDEGAVPVFRRIESA